MFNFQKQVDSYIKLANDLSYYIALFDDVVDRNDPRGVVIKLSNLHYQLLMLAKKLTRPSSYNLDKSLMNIYRKVCEVKDKSKMGEISLPDIFSVINIYKLEFMTWAKENLEKKACANIAGAIMEIELPGYEIKAIKKPTKS